MILKAIGVLLLQFALLSGAQAGSATCTGKFANPITDYCWSCVFPMTIGNKAVWKMQQDDNNSNDTEDDGPLCGCTNPPRVGLKTGFWEPSRSVDVTRTPYCFVALGGVTIDFGVDAPKHSQTATKEGRTPHAFYQLHWYTNPLLFWLELLLDDYCLEKGVFDIAYITEIDPLWADSVTS